MIRSNETISSAARPLPLPVDLMAGAVHGAPVMSDSQKTVLVFDSGLGGLTVLQQLREVMPGVRFVYAADDAGFPYGGLSEAALIERVGVVMDRLLASHRPDLVVIACNTASTLVLPMLRARFAIPFVGTVPAIKPAAAATRSGHVSVLGTPGTVKRDYTRALIDSYAAHVTVTLVGATGLAALAESHLRGDAVSDEAVLAEIMPCFVEFSGSRTDVIALACTHYPLLLETMRRIAPWPVVWIDPAPAIARRAVSLLGPSGQGPAPSEAVAVFTGEAGPGVALRAALSHWGLVRLHNEAMPLHRRS